MIISANMITRIIFASVFLLMAGLANAQERQSLIILTSFPDTIYKPFKHAFEKQNPDIELFILNRKTSAAISYIQDGVNHQVDLFWASAPDAFEILKQSGKLQKLKRVNRSPAAKVLGYPINDPDGFYAGFAISGYGIMWNSDYLSRYKLPAPARWDDLRKSFYANHIGISAPSRSGTTHLIVEIILQTKGWEEGWRTLIEIGGNLATVTARSFGVPSGVEQGFFGVGLVIDFFGLRSRAEGQPVKFRYPVLTKMLPANIALVKGAENPAVANRFIEFLLSDDGQRILFRPGIFRLPVNPEIYRDAPIGFPNPFTFPSDSAAPLFDINLSKTRYHLVNALFDQLITYRLRELKEAWSLVHRAENLLAHSQSKKLKADIAKARALIEKFPVSVAEAREVQFSSQFARHKPGFVVSATQNQREVEWRSDALRRYDVAAQIAERVLSTLTERDNPGRPK